MEKTWRWFGPKDIISLEILRQIGVEGIVTSLYDVPNGEVWSLERVQSLQQRIEAAGMRWSVVESLPVSEGIKYASGNRDALIDNYIKGLEALGQCGINTVCYNFMPVIDWVRTNLDYTLEDGSGSLYFDYSRYAYFYVKILGRKGYEKDFSSEILEKVEELDRTMSPEEKWGLVDTIILKTQGFISGNFSGDEKEPVRKFNDMLDLYSGMSKDDLRDNLRYFLQAVMPVCDKFGINMCIHPDDPPMPVFGIPRIVCNAEDIRWILNAVDNFHNGLTFCAGSLSSGAHNKVEEMAREFAPRTHFVHLRSCTVLPSGDFYEAPHLDGSVKLTNLIRIFENEGRNIPMRVDHGKTLDGDRGKAYNPGYSFLGRMLAFGQVSGMIQTIKEEESH